MYRHAITPSPDDDLFLAAQQLRQLYDTCAGRKRPSIHNFWQHNSHCLPTLLPTTVEASVRCPPCRQYLAQAEVWSGLVVEITQRLEDKLSYKQRRAMQTWFTPRSAPWAYLRLCCTPMQLCTAFAYNWQTRRCGVLLRCVLPLLLVLAIVVVCTVVGIWEINAQHDRRVAAAAADAAGSTPAAASPASPQPLRPSPAPSNATIWSRAAGELSLVARGNLSYK
jgi:hypothetical protein